MKKTVEYWTISEFSPEIKAEICEKYRDYQIGFWEPEFQLLFWKEVLSKFGVTDTLPLDSRKLR